ncbi:MAG: FtsQ-type POTRA domain-containing protein, partial [Fusobacterium periodonticum]|nr:FtsQ-type POTRA domain-containing protein [Fusobacterium periodonticum]
MKVRLLILNIIMYLVYMLPQNFFRLDYFNINKVDIQESAKMLQPELTKLSEKLYNKNIIYIDSNEIKEFLEKDVRVEDVTITKKSLGEISIDVKEKDLSYYAVIGKNIYLVDKAGEIFAYLNEKDVEEVPFIVANSEDEIKEITEFLNELSDLAIFKNISQIYKINDKEFVIILTDG